jgi:hypothetical protein
VKLRLDLVTGLSLARTALGVGAFLAPVPTLKALALDVENNPQSTFLARIAGSRDIALGVATLVATGKARRFMVATGVAVDTADALSALLESSSGVLTKGRAIYQAVPALLAAGVGVAALVEDLRATPVEG